MNPIQTAIREAFAEDRKRLADHYRLLRVKSPRMARLFRRALHRAALQCVDISADIIYNHPQVLRNYSEDDATS